MKRLFCCLTVCCLLFTGCAAAGEWIKEPVTFYYVRKNYQKDMDHVIAGEVREAAGHRDDLSYLLALYCMGPAAEDLHSLLPRNTTIVPTERTANSVQLTLSETVQTITDAEFTLASACIAMTCMELIDVQQVTILCEDRNITIQEENLLLFHSMPQNPQEEIN